MRLGLVLLGVVAVVAGCADSALEDDSPLGTDTLLPPPDEPAPGSVPIGDPCLESDQCQFPGICAAPWDGEGAVLVCVEDCVSNDDPAQWCADDTACCDPAAVCGPRGLCQPTASVDGTGTTGSTNDDSSVDSTGSSGSGESDSTSGGERGSGSESDSSGTGGSSTT